MPSNYNNEIKRKTKSIEREPVILITVEGNNKTEKNYLTSFRKYGLNIRFVKCNETDAKSMAEHHKKEYEDIDLGSVKGDASFLLCDMDLDVAKATKIDEAKLILKDTKTEVIVSNPCFELWFLQFFQQPSSKQYNSSEEVIEDLKKHITNYTKSMPVSSKIKVADLKRAISNAKTLRKMSESAGRKEWTKDFNPNTDVYKVIEKFNELSDSKILR